MSQSVWGNSKALIESLAKPETDEQRAQRLQREAEEQARRESEALNHRAQQLCNRVEAKCENYSTGGLSSNYVDTYQHEVSDTWTATEISLAFQKWSAPYIANGTFQSLNLHQLGPSQKFTGDRNGRLQANFIRYVDSTGKRKINVHINAK